MVEVYTAPSIFLNHGGGPLPLIGDADNLEIARSLREARSYLDFNLLKAIILVTAHWETDVVSISSGVKHDLLFDYNNFPPETYKYTYDAIGDPILARRLHHAFSEKNISSELDSERGWDHGVFVPMLLLRPEADIPIVQVSVMTNQDAKKHYEVGKVLAEFRKQGAAVIGSGLSYHNMKRFKEAAKNPDSLMEGILFDDFLNDVCTGDEEHRELIMEWEKVPEAFQSHPKGEAEHLMPLIVSAGAGGSSKGKRVFKSIFEKKFAVSGYIWE